MVLGGTHHVRTAVNALCFRGTCSLCLLSCSTCKVSYSPSNASSVCLSLLCLSEIRAFKRSFTPTPNTRDFHSGVGLRPLKLCVFKASCLLYQKVLKSLCPGSHLVLARIWKYGLFLSAHHLLGQRHREQPLVLCPPYRLILSS